MSKTNEVTDAELTQLAERLNAAGSSRGPHAVTVEIGAEDADAASSAILSLMERIAVLEDTDRRELNARLTAMASEDHARATLAETRLATATEALRGLLDGPTSGEGGKEYVSRMLKARDHAFDVLSIIEAGTVEHPDSGGT